MNNDRSEHQAGGEHTDDQAPGWDGDTLIRDIAYHAFYCPRAVAGKYQWDPLTSCILFVKGVVKEATGRTKISFIDFISTFSQEFGPSTDEDRDQETGNLSRFFQAFAKRLAYLEGYRPKERDFAVDVLQDAFCGLMHSRFEWGKGGAPTKGEVITMAKVLLARQGKPRRKDWPKSAWSTFLKAAHLDWLNNGPAGRPPQKREVDEVAKAKQEAHSIMTKESNKRAREIGWINFLAEVKGAAGGKPAALQNEAERLTEAYGQPGHLEEDEESENC